MRYLQEGSLSRLLAALSQVVIQTEALNLAHLDDNACSKFQGKKLNQ